jgi:hypothetical protein
VADRLEAASSGFREGLRDTTKGFGDSGQQYERAIAVERLVALFGVG